MATVYDTEERRAKKLAQVRMLLAKADSTKFPDEADTFRAKADELMAQYAIEAFEVTGHDDEHRRPEPDQPWHRHLVVLGQRAQRRALGTRSAARQPLPRAAGVLATQLQLAHGQA
jgi:hypothetical protein